jgi:hypothetical protein
MRLETKALLLAATMIVCGTTPSQAPEAIAMLLVPLLSSAGIVGAIGFTGVAYLALGIGYAVSALAAYGVSALLSEAFKPAAPAVPKPEDGKFNLKQAVPPLTYILGRVKKGGDYVFLEETGGTAYHVIVSAGHRINQIVKFYLHDEVATVDGSGVVTSPSHFGSNVVIQSRIGLDAETAYAPVVSAFNDTDIWSNDHRGDGLASLMMSAATVAAEDYQTVYPQQMPQPLAEIEGALLYDPRDATTTYSENFALMRFWHLTHPVGGKLSIDDMYLPDWQHAADVCDGTVVNRSGASEPRYHGGLWFRATDDPVAVGRTIDQAGELVIYERPDGKIGVHAGEDVAADIRLTADKIHSVQLDANRRKSTNVVAVRGRWTDPDNEFSTVDAAPYGSLYDTEDERTKTVENVAVQRHNHMARMEKLAFIRANAPRATVVVDYDSETKLIRQRRFVTVHYPPRLDEARIELTGKVTLSLRNMTVSFEGIVVPTNLFLFDAATEEGVPGGAVVAVGSAGVPAPVNFNAVVGSDTVSGGTATYIGGTWKHVSDALRYEMEWEPTAGGNAERVLSNANDDGVDSAYLADGVEYKVRLRAWGVGTSSDWTDYQIVTTTPDATGPDDVTGVSTTGGTLQATFDWTAPADAEYRGARVLYSQTNNVGTAIQDGAPEYGVSSATDSRIVTGLAAGTWYGWVQAINEAGTPGTAVATGSFTVTS